MPFVSKFSGHGRIPGIHKPASPPVPVVANTATGSTTLTFTINNFNANLIYTESISPNQGTLSRTGNTISITGLTASTAYTVTVNARNSGGISTGSGSATTAAPPPFFPPFFPFFPFFPPAFPPFFPPAFPPFFPGFPPSFPPPPPRPPSVKTAPMASLSDLQKLQILTKDYGYLEAKYLTEDDILETINIQQSQSGEIILADKSTTKIVSVDSYSSVYDIYYLNEESYAENITLLCQRDGEITFLPVSEIKNSDMIFNHEENKFIKISTISSETVSGILYNIDCKEIKHYIIHSSIGYINKLER